MGLYWQGSLLLVMIDVFGDLDFMSYYTWIHSYFGFSLFKKYLDRMSLIRNETIYMLLVVAISKHT